MLVGGVARDRDRRDVRDRRPRRRLAALACGPGGRSRRLRLERRFEPDRVMCGDDAHLVLTAWNRKLLPLPWLRTEEPLPTELRPDDEDERPRLVARRADAGQRLDARPVRARSSAGSTSGRSGAASTGSGRSRCRPAICSARPSRRRIASSAATLVVRPRTVPVRRFEAARDRAGDAPGATRPGRGPEPVRRASARTRRATRSATSTGGRRPGSASRSSSGSTRRAIATSSSPSTSRPTDGRLDRPPRRRPRRDAVRRGGVARPGSSRPRAPPAAWLSPRSPGTHRPVRVPRSERRGAPGRPGRRPAGPDQPVPVGAVRAPPRPAREDGPAGHADRDRLGPRSGTVAAGRPPA